MVDFHVSGNSVLSNQAGSCIDEFPNFGVELNSLDIAIEERVSRFHFSPNDVISLLTTPGLWTAVHFEALNVYFSRREVLVPHFDERNIEVLRSADHAREIIFSDYIRLQKDGVICFPDLNLDGLEVITLLRTLYIVRLSYLFAPDGRLWTVCRFSDYCDWNSALLDKLVKASSSYQIAMSQCQDEIMVIYLKLTKPYKAHFLSALRRASQVQVQAPEPDEEADVVDIDTESDFSEESPSPEEITNTELEIEETLESDDLAELSIDENSSTLADGFLFVSPEELVVEDLPSSFVTTPEIVPYLVKRFDSSNIFDNG